MVCPNACNKDQICVQTIRGPTCTCPNGYGFNQIANACEGSIENTIAVILNFFDVQFFADVNECEESNPCTYGSNCTNVIGSFICSRSCSIGFVFDTDINRCRGKLKIKALYSHRFFYYSYVSLRKT